MPSVKYWSGSSWLSPGYFGKLRMWDGSQWRVVEPIVAEASGFASFSPPSGYLQDLTYDGSTSASVTITATTSVVWTWTRDAAIGTASIASGGSGTSITFSLSNALNARSVTFTVSAGGSNWTVYLYTDGTGGGGGDIGGNK